MFIENIFKEVQQKARYLMVEWAIFNFMQSVK